MTPGKRLFDLSVSLLLAVLLAPVIVITALALLAPSLRQVTGTIAALLSRWAAARAQRQSDDALWGLALQDTRVMRDLQVASLRSETQN